MSDKRNRRTMGDHSAAGETSREAAVVSVAYPTIIRNLNQLASRAAHLAEHDPNPSRCKKWRKLTRYLARRLARHVLAEVGAWRWGERR
jgi:hypothetical protein